MSTASASPAAQWLNGVPIETSKFLFFIGSAEADLRAELSRRGWQGRVIAVAAAARLTASMQLAATLEPDSENPVVALDPGVMREHRDAVKQAARQSRATWFGARANQEAKQRNGAIYRTNTLRNACTIAREADASVLGDAFAGLPAAGDRRRPVARSQHQPTSPRTAIAPSSLPPTPRFGPCSLPASSRDVVVEADPTGDQRAAPVRPAAVPRSRGSSPRAASILNRCAHSRGRTFFYRVGDHDPWPWLNERGLDCGRLRSWGSVLTTAFDLARVMGCSPDRLCRRRSRRSPTIALRAWDDVRRSLAPERDVGTADRVVLGGVDPDRGPRPTKSASTAPPCERRRTCDRSATGSPLRPRSRSEVR